MNDRAEYLKRKAFFQSLITLYGRNVVDEILKDESIEIYTLHLCSSNKDNSSFEQIAHKRNIEIKYHTKTDLSRISKNAKQDQGVAIDIMSSTYKSIDSLVESDLSSGNFIALDGINNPQNLGLIIRSCAASKIDGIILGRQKSAKISPLVMKASAGTLFKMPIYYCAQLLPSLEKLKLQGWSIVTLDSHATSSLDALKDASRSIFVLGSESDGVSSEIKSLSSMSVSIPMNRGVESLNVAVTAALIAFKVGSCD